MAEIRIELPDGTGGYGNADVDKIVRRVFKRVLGAILPMKTIEVQLVGGLVKPDSIGIGITTDNKSKFELLRVAVQFAASQSITPLNISGAKCDYFDNVIWLEFSADHQISADMAQDAPYVSPLHDEALTYSKWMDFFVYGVNPVNIDYPNMNPEAVPDEVAVVVTEKDIVAYAQANPLLQLEIQRMREAAHSWPAYQKDTYKGFPLGNPTMPKTHLTVGGTDKTLSEFSALYPNLADEPVNKHGFTEKQLAPFKHYLKPSNAPEGAHGGYPLDGAIDGMKKLVSPTAMSKDELEYSLGIKLKSDSPTFQDVMDAWKKKGLFDVPFMSPMLVDDSAYNFAGLSVDSEPLIPPPPSVLTWISMLERYVDDDFQKKDTSEIFDVSKELIDRLLTIQRKALDLMGKGALDYDLKLPADEFDPGAKDK